MIIYVYSPPPLIYMHLQIPIFHVNFCTPIIQVIFSIPLSLTPVFFAHDQPNANTLFALKKLKVRKGGISRDTISFV